MNPLQEAFNRYHTDKDVDHHNYGEFYYPYVQKWVDRPGLLIEIGVQTGGSLQAWKEFFPLFTVVGLDTDLTQYKYLDDDERVHVIHGNQAVVEDLERLIEEFGRPSIVVDDGSHIPVHQMLSYEVLFPHIVPEGLYILEDLQTSFPCYPWRNPSDPSTVEYLTKEVPKVMGNGIGGYADPRNETPENKALMGPYPLNVRGIHFHRFCCVVEKW